MNDESKWFRDQIAEIFGDGAQSSLARFLVLCGDDRPFTTIRRSISNYASGKYSPPGELKAILTMARNPSIITEMLMSARKEVEPAFQLLPLRKPAKKRATKNK